MTQSLPFTGNTDADRLIAADPLALLIGMLLDQQIKIEQAFLGPLLLRERMGGVLDAAAIAELDEEALIELFRGPPALHRFPANMARRTQALCRYLVDRYPGVPQQLWEGAETGAELHRRLMELPGFGAAKVGTLVAILGKRLHQAPPGWEAVAPRHMTLADVETHEDLAAYREFKRSTKRARSEVKSPPRSR